METRPTYSYYKKVAAVLMIFALLWLTISAPFVLRSQQLFSQDSEIEAPFAGSEEESSNPFGNSEEKSSKTSTTFSEEYMHDHYKSAYLFFIALQGHNSESNNLYTSHLVELLSPPPERM